MKTSNFLGVDFGRKGGRLGLNLFSLRFLQLLLESLHAGEQVVGGGLLALGDETLVIELLLQSLQRCLQLSHSWNVSNIAFVAWQETRERYRLLFVRLANVLQLSKNIFFFMLGGLVLGAEDVVALLPLSRVLLPLCPLLLPRLVRRGVDLQTAVLVMVCRPVVKRHNEHVYLNK